MTSPAYAPPAQPHWSVGRCWCDDFHRDQATTLLLIYPPWGPRAHEVYGAKRWLDHLAACPQCWRAVSDSGSSWLERLCAVGLVVYDREAKPRGWSRPGG